MDTRAKPGNDSGFQASEAICNSPGLVAWVNYHYGVVYVRFVGTHRDYDAIDAQNV